MGNETAKKRLKISEEMAMLASSLADSLECTRFKTEGFDNDDDLFNKKLSFEEVIFRLEKNNDVMLKKFMTFELHLIYSTLLYLQSLAPLTFEESYRNGTQVNSEMVDDLFASLPPPVPGLIRYMWFGHTSTPRPVDVPEFVANQITVIAGQAELNKGSLNQLPYDEYLKVEREIHRLLRPYIEAQYPNYKPVPRWKRILHKFGLDSE